MTTVEDTLTTTRGQAPRRQLPSRGGKFGELSAATNGMMLLLYAVSITWPIKFQLGPLFITFSRIMLIALLVPMALRILSGRYGGIKSADIFVVLFGLWAFVSMAVNHGVGNVVESSGMFFVETAGAYMFGRVFMRSAQDFYVFVRFMIISVLISLPFATVELFTGEPFLLDILKSVNPLPGIFVFPDSVDYEPRLGLHRVQYTLVHPILFGMMCASLVALCFVVMTRGDGFGKKAFWGSVVIYATFTGLSSAGWMSGLMQIAFLIYERFTRWFAFRWKAIFWGFVAFYVFVSIFASHAPLVVLATKFTLSPHTAWFRVVIWEFGSAEVLRHPIFGIGMNDWVRPHWMPPSVDNHWLLMAMRFGFPGIILLGLAVMIPIFAVGRAKIREYNDLKACQIGYMCCMISWLVSLCTVAISVEILSLFMTVLAGGYWIADQARAEAGEVPDPRARGGRTTTRSPRRAPPGADTRTDLKTSRTRPARSTKPPRSERAKPATQPRRKPLPRRS